MYTIIFPPVFIAVFTLADIGGGTCPSDLVHTASIAVAIGAKYQCQQDYGIIYLEMSTLLLT